MQNVNMNRNRIKHVRELRGWSQADVAEKLGCDARSVGRWERGVVSPSSYYRQRLCLLFEQNMEELGLLEEASSNVQEAEPLEQEPLQERSEQEGETVQMPPEREHSSVKEKRDQGQQLVSIPATIPTWMVIGLLLMIFILATPPRAWKGVGFSFSRFSIFCFLGGCPTSVRPDHSDL